MKRKKPYTDRGITRVPCARCGQPSSQQWQVCADGGVWRAICRRCDIELNRMVLRWIGDPQWREKVARYTQELAHV